MRHGPLRQGVASAVAVLALVACAADPSDERSDETTTTTAAATTTTVAPASTTTSASPSTTTPVGRAFVIPTTVQPLVSPPAAPTASGAMIPLHELAAGDCVDLPGLGMPESITVDGGAQRRACDEPHGVEVYAVVSLNDDPAADYPGDGAVLGAADRLCLDAFEGYVGQPYAESNLEVVHLRPDEAAWTARDRTVACAVHNRNLEPLNAPVRQPEAE